MGQGGRLGPTGADTKATEEATQVGGYSRWGDLTITGDNQNAPWTCSTGQSGWLRRSDD